MRFKTTLCDNKDGTATFGTALVQNSKGEWREIGRTRAYQTYPRMVRARTAADNLCKAHHKASCAAAGVAFFGVDLVIDHA